MVCGHRDEIVARLAAGYQERKSALGLAGNGTAVELWKSRDGRTWSIIMTHANGMACLVAAGESWEAVPVPGSKA